MNFHVYALTRPMSDGTETLSYVYANYFLCRKITSTERLALLKKASEQFALKLYTHHPSPLLPKAEFVGPIDYYQVMPLVFRHSSINLNITLRSIHSGHIRFAVWISWEAAVFF